MKKVVLSVAIMSFALLANAQVLNCLLYTSDAADE